MQKLADRGRKGFPHRPPNRACSLQSRFPHRDRHAIIWASSKVKSPRSAKYEFGINLCQYCVRPKLEFPFTCFFLKLRKRRLINGLDDIGLTLQYADDIKTFEKDYFKTYSWL